MKIKTLIVTVLILAVLSVAAFYFNRSAPPPSSDPRINQPVVQSSAVESAAKIKISEQGKSVILTKDAENNWKVSTYFDLPADFQKLAEFVNQLTSSKVEQFVTSTPEKLRRLEFQDTQIALLDSADKPIWSITLGKQAEAGGRFIRFGEEAKGYRATMNTWLDNDSKSWVNAALIPLKTDDVARIELDVPNAEPVIAARAKKEDGFAMEKLPEGKKFKVDKLLSVLSSFTSLRFNETTDLTDPNVAAAKQNLRNAKVTTFDGRTWTIALGRKPEQKIIKPPVAKPDGKTGPAALGSLTDVVKPASEAQPASPPADKGGPVKVAEPDIETIPAGPVYAFISSSDGKASINTMMEKRAFQVDEFAFGNFPQTREELVDVAPPPPPPPPSSSPATSSAPPPAADAKAAQPK